MKITYESHKLMSFFVENNCLIPIKQTKATDSFFSHFFKELISAVAYVNRQKKQSFYNLKITSIEHIKQIPNLKHLVLMGSLIKHVKQLMNIR